MTLLTALLMHRSAATLIPTYTSSPTLHVVTMTSPVPVLCVVLLSVCAADARRLPRQFDVVQPDQAACVQDGVSYPIGASVPDIDDDPCTFGCRCYSPGIIHCATVKTARACLRPDLPCVDAVAVYHPHHCCPTWTCPNVKPSRQDRRCT
ncbi:PREDICTED: uncharacterized protein LOC109484837 [Branchiostoma belcheri]|uniref:Uncharacterized protein LOC109484837 n=1 Tax=Branchiostoma belcheri TaxID=7741 RepID=A0A6P5A307_BRABE|nr:PREDICTED: uncharacterized protein LOC109484837 [Branchiostoma belcheri]